MKLRVGGLHESRQKIEDMNFELLYLQRFNLTLLRTHLLLPLQLRFGESLHTILKPIKLFPTRLELFLHVVQLLGILRLSIFDSLVKVKLNLTEGLQSSDEVVMEDAEVSEGLGLRLTILLL